MNPVEKIREQHRTALLQGLAAKPHRKRIMHLDDIRSIGIIVHNLNDEEQITLTQFSHHMTTNRGTMVRKLESILNIPISWWRTTGFWRIIRIALRSWDITERSGSTASWEAAF